jgi:S-adenosylmethionine decarboxylase
MSTTPTPKIELRELPPVHDFTGRHLLLAYEGCEADLNDLPAIEAALREAAAATGATVRGATSTTFIPQGLSIVLVLSESHASIHTSPEFRAAFLDIFTCGTRCRVERFDEVLRERLRPAQVRSQSIAR